MSVDRESSRNRRNAAADRLTGSTGRNARDLPANEEAVSASSMERMYVRVLMVWLAVLAGLWWLQQAFL